MEAYDLAVDPAERTNLGPDLTPGDSKKAARLKKLLKSLIQRPSARPDTLPETHEALLKALGY